MDISEIVTAYGAYYEKNAANKQRLLRKLVQSSVTPGHCTEIKTDDTIYRLGQVTCGNIVRPFRTTFDGNSPVTFTPNELTLRKIKMDFSLYPDDIEASWLGFLASNNKSKKDWPLIAYLIEDVIIPQIHSDMETSAYFWGSYNASGTTPGAVMDGLKAQLVAGITANTINQITGVGAMATATAFDQIEAIFDALPDLYKTVDMTIFVSPSVHMAYLRDKRTQGFYQLSSDASINDRVDFSKCRVVGLPSMAGYNYAFATTKNNLLHLSKRTESKNSFNVETSRRSVDIFGDWWEGIGFGINQAVWTTHEEPVTPAPAGD